jgi:hypothetical protein
VSLLVDEIGDVLDMDASSYERPPDNLDPSARELISGVYKMKDGLLLVLDTERAVEVGSIPASLNARLEAPSTEAATTGRRSASPVSDALAAAQPETTMPRNSTSNKKKVATRKTN